MRICVGSQSLIHCDMLLAIVATFDFIMNDVNDIKFGELSFNWHLSTVLWVLFCFATLDLVFCLSCNWPVRNVGTLCVLCVFSCVFSVCSPVCSLVYSPVCSPVCSLCVLCVLLIMAFLFDILTFWIYWFEFVRCLMPALHHELPATKPSHKIFLLLSKRRPGAVCLMCRGRVGAPLPSGNSVIIRIIYFWREGTVPEEQTCVCHVSGGFNQWWWNVWSQDVKCWMRATCAPPFMMASIMHWGWQH